LEKDGEQKRSSWARIALLAGCSSTSNGGFPLAGADREKAAHSEPVWHLNRGIRQADGVDRAVALAPAEKVVLQKFLSPSK